MNSKLERYNTLIKSETCQIDYDKLKESSFSIKLGNLIEIFELANWRHWDDVKTTLTEIGEYATKIAGKRKPSGDKLT